MDTHHLNLDGTGLVITDFALTPTLAVIRVACTGSMAACPRCGRPSDRVHSRYFRTIADLPAHDRPVVLRLVVRRFRCTTPDCPRAIFCERLPDLVAPRARASGRLADTHRLVGLALGGEAGARLAGHLAIPTSPDTLLRRVKRRCQPRGSSASTTGPGAKDGVTGRSSSTWSAAASSTCCPTATPRRSRRGWRPIPASS